MKIGNKNATNLARYFNLLQTPSIQFLQLQIQIHFNGRVLCNLIATHCFVHSMQTAKLAAKNSLVRFDMRGKEIYMFL